MRRVVRKVGRRKLAAANGRRAQADQMGVEGTSAGAFGQSALQREAAEKQNAQDNYDGDNDDLNQAHNKLLEWLRTNKTNEQ